MKRFAAFVLIFALVLSLSGCGFTLFQKTYEKTTGETLPEGHIAEKTYTYPETITTTFPDGSTWKTEYLFQDAVNEDRLVYKQCIGAVYYENDVEVRREDWTADEEGNPLTVTCDGVTTAYSYAYDDQGRITEITRSQNGQCIGRTVTEYGENGNIVRVTHYDGENQVTALEEYSREGSYETVLVSYNAGDTSSCRWEHTYDYNDRIARRIVYDSAGTLLSTAIYTYTGIRNEYWVND